MVFIFFKFYSFAFLMKSLFHKAKSNCTVITIQITGSQKITAQYWNLGMKTITKMTFPKNSMTDEISGNNFCPIPCNALRV